MISNNISFKTQLKKFGGYGYADLFKRYKNTICSFTKINEEIQNKIFRDNFLEIVCWWEPPKFSEKVVKKLTCQ